MPLDLTGAELATAATACRAMAYQEGERAKKIDNPTMREPLASNAQRYAARDLFTKMVEGTEGWQRESLLELLEIFVHARREVRNGTMAWEESVGRWNRLYPRGFDRLRVEVLLPLPKCKGAFFQLLDKQDPKALVTDVPNSLSIALRLSINFRRCSCWAQTPHIPAGTNIESRLVPPGSTAGRFGKNTASRLEA